MRPRPFVLAAAGGLLAGIAVGATRSNPVEAALLGAVGAVLAGVFAGVAVGLTGPHVPQFDDTAVGSALLVLSIFGLVLLGGRPATGVLSALLGGVGAALVGLDSGLKRAPGDEPGFDADPPGADGDTPAVDGNPPAVDEGPRGRGRP